MSTQSSTGQRNPARLVMSPAEITACFDEIFPDRIALGWTFEIEHMEPYMARVRLPFHARNVRPGNTMSGPAMFHLADYAMWVLIMGMTGREGVAAVTSNLSITYLRPAPAGDLVGRARILRLGRRLAAGDIEITAGGDPAIVAHATTSYVMPNASK